MIEHTMITVTIRDLCQWDRDGGAPEFAEPYSIYRFRDGDFVLYVGKTNREILERLYEHIGIEGQTQMTTLIEDNLPESLNWEIDLFTVQECIPLIKKHLKLELIQEWNYDLAEKAMICESRPAVNSILRVEHLTLPAKYTQKRLERTKRAWALYAPSDPEAE